MSYFQTLLSLLAVSGGGGGQPTPTLNLDFTSALPGQVTFSRSSTSKAIVGGAFTTIASGAPAIESWNSKSQGLRVNGAASNLLSLSNVLTDASWGLTAMTIAAGSDPGPDGTAMWAVSETTATSTHSIGRGLASIAAGTTQTFSCFARRPAGCTRFAIAMRIAPQFNNNGSATVFRYDGTLMYYVAATDATATNVSCKMVDLGGGLYFCSTTLTVASTGTWNYLVNSVDETNSNGPFPNVSYVGIVGQGPELSHCQISNTAGPASYCDNPTSTPGASVAAESAIFNDISWLNTSVGTLVVEHDCVAGTVIGSGVNAVLSGQPLNFLTATAKTALAWDGSGSDLVNNGGPTTAGTTPTFGADVRLLATSAASNFGHIKSIKYYPSRLTVAQCQALTTPTSTANPSAWRIATRAGLPMHKTATAGTQLAFCSRVPATIRGSRGKLRVDFANFSFPGNAVANSVVIDGCALERVTGVTETVLFKFGGATGLTMASGAANIVSDDMLPSQFTSLPQFNDGDVYFLRTYGHCLVSGDSYATSRSLSETGVTAWGWDNSVTAPDQPVTGTGNITFSGSHIASTAALAPILIGVSVSGDPKSAFILGDSRVEGVSGNGGSIVGYTFIQKACDNLGIPSLAHCLGGTSQVTTQPYVSLWGPYMAYARILIDEMGTNNGNQLLQFGDAWVAAKKTYGVDKIVHAGLSPSTQDTVDHWATTANQSSPRAFPSGMENLWSFAAQTGQIDTAQTFTSASIRDSTTPGLWRVNGTAYAYTQDGLHQSVAGDNAMATELQPSLSALVMS